MNDQGFPRIRYPAHLSLYECGQRHGEKYRQGIQELAAIRRGLMLEKAPRLKDKLDELALAQFEVSKLFHPNLTQELKGIQEGAKLSLTDIVILNNYTDFRDIKLPEEGCTTLYYKNKNKSGGGQTWDMHGSAKKYLCLIEIEAAADRPASLVLSLTGCLGLMGVNQFGVLIGVNNINTHQARAALIWPMLVRAVLDHKNLDQSLDCLINAPVTSGHNYLLFQDYRGMHLEISPDLVENVGTLQIDQEGTIFHTNHCYGPQHQKREDPLAANSTSLERHELMQQMSTSITDFSSAYKALTSHEGYPKSICSHYESDSQDPASTCGGGLFETQTGAIKFWRGCSTYDENYKVFDYKLHQGESIFPFERVLNE
jgi:isopenicillin-N N-acyltransferase like protein